MEKYEALFKERKRVGENLYEIMKEKGYTKISFSKAVNISRPTLNHLFEGEINSITTFEKHLEKISMVLSMDVADFCIRRESTNLVQRAVYSANEPVNYTPGELEKDMFDVLESLIDLCEFYY